MMPLYGGIFALFLATGAYGAIGPDCNLYIKNKFIQPDGFNRSGVLAGETPDSVSFPGPLIAAHKGDRFRLNVIDQLTNTSMETSTSVHWHGIFQEGTNWADGPVGVTQCPISPGHSFLYKFRVPDQVGTFWYHSHFSTQYCDGFRGPLVIYDPHDPYRSHYDVDDESTVITLADWYHLPSPIIAAINAPAQPNSTLINGKGRYPGGPRSPLAVITVIPQKRYRFRLVSISCDPSFTFSIDGHQMTIIEVEGNNVQPVTVDSIPIFAGQRYSFILHANSPVSNYWIRALSSSTPTGFEDGVNSAILHYSGAPHADPTTTQPAILNQLQETQLHPLVNPAAPGIPRPGAADININLNTTFNGTEWAINNASFVPPTVPVMLQIMSGAHTAQELLPPGDVYALPPGKVIEVSVPGGSTGSPHPMHLHGHAFSVVRSAGSSVYNYDNPVKRDVVSAGVAGDNVTIRFVTDNSGPWIFHCHIDFHLNRGLAVVFAENIPAIAHENPPIAWDELCPIYDRLNQD